MLYGTRLSDSHYAFHTIRKCLRSVVLSQRVTRQLRKQYNVLAMLDVQCQLKKRTPDVEVVQYQRLNLWIEFLIEH